MQEKLLKAGSSVTLHMRHLSGILFSGETISRWWIGSDIIQIALGELCILMGTEQAIAAYRLGETPTREVIFFLLGILLVQKSGQTLRTHASQVFTHAIASRQRLILAHLKRTDLVSVESLGQAKILRAMTSDAARVLESSKDVVWLISSALMAFLSLGYFIVTSPHAAPLGLVLIVASAVLISITGLRVEELTQEYAESKDEINDSIGALLKGFAQVKLHRPRSESISASVAEQTKRNLSISESLYRAYFTSGAALQALLFAVVGLVAFGYAPLFPESAPHIDRLVIAAFFMFEPVTMLFLDQLRISRAGAALKRIDAVVGVLTSAQGEEETSGHMPETFSSLQLRGVRFAYPARDDGRSFGIGPIDLDLRPGEILFITGHNGSGKSTLLKVLTGLYHRTAGEILLDGDALPKLQTSRQRELFAAIMSDFVLFEQGYGLEAVSETRVHALLAELQLDHVVSFEEGRFTTVDLSTGQRKRLAMVVALLQDRPIYVFDEWAADQDPGFRKMFYRRLLPMLKEQGKAVMAVTHDDHYFDVADHRLHLDGGERS